MMQRLENLPNWKNFKGLNLFSLSKKRSSVGLKQSKSTSTIKKTKKTNLITKMFNKLAEEDLDNKN